MAFVLAMRSLLVLALCSAPSLGWADLTFDEELLTASAGVYCDIGSVGSSEAPGTDVGQIDLLEYTPEFEWDTMVVPAKIGLSFGVRTQTVDGAVLENVIVRLTHPAFPETGTTQQVYVTTMDALSINAYSFDIPRELTVGPWVLQAEWDGQILYRAEFTVVDAKMLPAIANSCGGGMLS